MFTHKNNMITSTIVIPKKASIVWEALTNKEQFKKWYFDIPDFVLSKGCTFHFYEPGDQQQYRHVCTILDIVPYQKFVHTWTHPDLSKGVTIVSWSLQENAGLTTVTLHHEGLENIQDAGPAFDPKNYQIGWDQILHNLKKSIHDMEL